MDLRRAILCGCRYDFFFSVFQAQVTKFGNYFLSSKYTTAVDNLSYMLAAANTLATNKVSKKCVDNYYADIIPPSYHCSSLSLSLSFSLSLSLSPFQYVVPSSLRLSSNQPISQSNKNLAVELTTIMGGSVGSFDIRVNTITDPDGTETKRGKPMSPGTDK